MSAAIVLGVRLALRTSRPGQLRAAMVALCSAAGTLAILSVIAVTVADRELNPARYADGGMDRMVTFIVALIALQVAGLAAVAGRLAAAMRTRRLANLRLLGLSAGRTRLVSAAEVAIAAAAGSTVAVALFPVVRPLLARLRVGGQSWPASALDPGIAAMVAVPLLVMGATIALAVLPEQLGSRQALGQARQSHALRPSWWPTAPLAAGIGVCLYVQIARRGDDEAAYIMLAGVLLLGAGMVLTVPIYVRLVAALMLRSRRQVPLLLAGRRLHAQPAAVNRVITGLLLGLFLVVGARAVVVAFETTPQYIGAAKQLKEGQRVKADVPASEVQATVARVTAFPGVRGVVAYPTLQALCDPSGPPRPCLDAIVATCAQIALVDPSAVGCRDGEVVVVGLPPAEAGAPAVTWIPRRNHAPDPAAGITIPSPQATFTADLLHLVVIPPSLSEVARVADTADHEVLVFGEPGRDLAQRLSDSGALANARSSWWDVADYDYVATLRSTVYSVAAVVMGLGLLAFAIAAVDRAIARRRELTSLRLVGIPAATLRQSQWIEALVPISGGAVLAIALGHLAGATYLALVGDTDLAPPWRPTLVLAAGAAIGGIVIAALTVVATNQRITPDTIRSE
ncbi:MAG: FtsX-like permease family protein [Dehalococcoidia bacterium]